MPPTLSFSSVTMRTASFGPTPLARVKLALSWTRMAWVRSPLDSTLKIANAQLGAHALHGRQQAEPLALGGIDEAIEMDMVLAHVGLDEAG